jgi:hypothetical protein
MAYYEQIVDEKKDLKSILMQKNILKKLLKIILIQIMQLDANLNLI